MAPFPSWPLWAGLGEVAGATVSADARVGMCAGAHACASAGAGSTACASLSLGITWSWGERSGEGVALRYASHGYHKSGDLQVLAS